MANSKAKWYGWAHVLERDAISGELEHVDVGYDGPMTEEEARIYAERIAAENRADENVSDAWAMVERLDEEE